MATQVYKSPFGQKKFFTQGTTSDDFTTSALAVCLGTDWEVGPYVLMKYEIGIAQPLYTEFVPDRSEFFALIVALGHEVPAIEELEAWQRTPVLVGAACRAFLEKE